MHTNRNAIKPLKGSRILSLALNLPGPAALWRLRQMGATCVKLEPPSGDPMAHYCRAAYDVMHAGIRVITADLKAPAGQRRVHGLLAKTDILLTSFRPSALRKLGLSWRDLRASYPDLNVVQIVGATGPEAEIAGHDLTYMAENGLINDLSLPATLFADMAGALMASEGCLAVSLERHRKATGSMVTVALRDAAQFLGNPRTWGLTLPTGPVGGAHAGYGVYACKDGRVAVAALEPHFATALLTSTGLATTQAARQTDWFSNATARRLKRYFAGQSCAQLSALATTHDLPLLCLQT